jgi:hypothetical protein
MKRFFTLITALTCFVTAFAQAPSIQNIYFNNTVTYPAGGNISVHIKPTGVFPLRNKFTLAVYDATGTNVVNAAIGTVNDFFAPV